jgi:hypothetical protein
MRPSGFTSANRAGVQRWLLSLLRRRRKPKVVADPLQALRAASVQYGGTV